MGNGLFWGIILIVIGLSIIFKIFFDVSIFRIVLAIAFILIGVKLLIGRPIFQHQGREADVIFGEKTIRANPIHDTEYNTVFGKTIYDFRNMDALDIRNTNIKFNTVFGSTEVYLPPDLPIRIHAEAAFSSARLPNKHNFAFGTVDYSTKSIRADDSVLYIEAHVVFGGLVIRQ